MYGKKRRISRRPRRGYRPTIAKKAVSKAVRNAKNRLFNRRVLQVVSRTVESKSVNFSATNKTLLNVNSSNWNGQVLNLIPQSSGSSPWMYDIPQGEAQGMRIGNVIRPTGLILHGVIRANTFYDATLNYNPCPLRVTMWICRINKHLEDSVTQLESIVDNSFFNAGSVSSGFLGTMLDLTRDVNPDQIQVLKKRSWYIGTSGFISGFGVNSPNNANQQYVNNDAKTSVMFRMNLSKLLPKVLRFNDATATPTNCRKLWLMFTTQRMDGQISSTSLGAYTGPVPAYIDMGCQFTYKDA